MKKNFHNPVTSTKSLVTWSFLVSALVLLGAIAMMPTQGQAQLADQSGTIGSSRCQTCHVEEYAIWESSKHARSYTALSPEQQKDPKCNTCHTVSGRPGMTGVGGVDCERCHGPGKYYSPRYVMKDRELAQAVGLIRPKATSCVQCHTQGAPTIRPFDHAKMWPRIDHSRSKIQADKAGRRADDAQSP